MVLLLNHLSAYGATRYALQGLHLKFISHTFYGSDAIIA